MIHFGFGANEVAEMTFAEIAYWIRASEDYLRHQPS
jgi:hypothetical protein